MPTPIDVAPFDVAAMLSALKQGASDQDLDALVQVPPKDFAKQVAAYRKRHGKLLVWCNTSDRYAVALFKKLDAVRRALTGEKFAEFWCHFTFSLDAAVTEGEAWAPSILPNGAVLFRNHHRIIAVSDASAGALCVSPQVLHAQLEALAEFYRARSYAPETGVFGLIHHGEAGVAWTSVVPDQLSAVGQTLVYLSRTFIEDARACGQFGPRHFILDDQVLAAAKASPSEHCILRVFSNKTFLHTTYWVSDEYDTIQYDYSYYFGEKPDEEGPRRLSMTTYVGAIQYKILEAVDRDGIEVLKHPEVARLAGLVPLVTQAIRTEYVREKVSQVTSFAPVFSSSAARPVTCFGEHVPFFDFAAAHGHNFVAVKGEYTKLPSIREGQVALEKQLDSMRTLFGAERALVWLPLEPSEPVSACFIEESDVFEYGAAAYQARLAAVFAWMAQHYEDARMADERSYLEEGGFPGEFALFFITAEAPELSSLHRLGREASRVMAGSVSVIVPEYGLVQGYRAGALDAGNASRFIRVDD